MKLLSDSDEPDNRMMTVIENYNTDIAMATRNGVALDALISLAGSIVECTLKSMPKGVRKEAWNILQRIMKRRFEKGDL